MGNRAVCALVAGVVLLLIASCATPAFAASPGQNGKLAYAGLDLSECPACYDDIYLLDLEPALRIRLTTAAGQDTAPRWSPNGQRIAFLSERDSPAQPCYPSCVSAVYVMNADGTGQTRLTSPTSSPVTRPTWSPDGSRIAFTVAADIWIMKNDGSDLQQITSGANARDLDWAPDGRELAFTAAGDGIDAIRPDGSGRRTIIPPDTGSFSGGAVQSPDWSPDGGRLTYTVIYLCEDEYCGELFTANADGTQRTAIAHEGTGFGYFEPPSWSPDGTRIASSLGPGFSSSSMTLLTLPADGSNEGQGYNTRGASPDWQPLPVETINPHVRPKAATPFRVPLVPAAQPCTSPNRQHGPPLAFGSCNPVQPGSSYLTVGVGDGNPALSRSVGSLRMDVKVGVPGPPDDSDVLVRFTLTNVMRAADLSEYTGELRTELKVRRTDRDPPGASPQSTTMDFPFGFAVLCSPTPGSSLDASTCTALTSANAVVPLAIEDTHRAVWALEKVRVYDGGPDEDADTEGDNSLFMTQGVFVP